MRPRSVWLDVDGKKNKKNVNQDEMDSLLKELHDFDQWARTNRKNESTCDEPSEVAILTFYRGQESALRRSISSWADPQSGNGYFERSDGNCVYLSIRIGTVDRFQGQEADLVLLSFVSPYATSFLQSTSCLLYTSPSPRD